MEIMSSPSASITSSSAATLTPASKQQTYTTAGTVYNPQSSQPLQAPARRGRFNKWANGVQSDLSLLPKSVLASLPMRAGARVPAFQQYSPLQQNYDRAISPGPFADHDHQLAKMPAENAHLRAVDHTMYPAPLFDGSAEDKENVADDSEDVDSDSDFGMDPLMGMTVKSLHNLASYPNPNQKRAQKALLRGTKPFPNGLGMASRSQTPANPVYNRPIGSPPKDEGPLFDIQRSCQPDPSALRRMQVNGRSGVHVSRDNTSSRKPPGFNARDRAFDFTPSSSALAAGPGAPRPLTAGPPGQRQYRPSTFESTFKALQTKNEHQQGQNDDDSLVDMRDSLHHAGLDGWPLFGDAPAPPVRGSGSSSPNDQSVAPGIKPMMPSREDPFSRMFRNSERDARTPGSDATWRGIRTPAHMVSLAPLPSWRDSDPKARSRFKAGTDRLTDAEMYARRENMDRIWYAGIDGLSKSPAEALRDVRIRQIENVHGVIGDGRPAQNKHQYERIEAWEANILSTAEHAQPLLNVAFAAIARYRSDDEKRFQSILSGEACGK